MNEPIYELTDSHRAADHGYKVSFIEHVEKEHGWRVEIVQKPESTRGFVPEPNRWMVERSFGCGSPPGLNFRRRLFRDVEKTIESSPGRPLGLWAGNIPRFGSLPVVNQSGVR